METNRRGDSSHGIMQVGYVMSENEIRNEKYLSIPYSGFCQGEKIFHNSSSTFMKVLHLNYLHYDRLSFIF